MNIHPRSQAFTAKIIRVPMELREGGCLNTRKYLATNASAAVSSINEQKASITYHDPGYAVTMHYSTEKDAVTEDREGLWCRKDFITAKSLHHLLNVLTHAAKQLKLIDSLKSCTMQYMVSLC